MRKQICLQIIILIIWEAASSATTLKNVVIVSVDAFHPAALGAGVTPTIHGVMTAGAYTLDVTVTGP